MLATEKTGRWAGARAKAAAKKTPAAAGKKPAKAAKPVAKKTVKPTAAKVAKKPAKAAAVAKKTAKAAKPVKAVKASKPVKTAKAVKTVKAAKSAKAVKAPKATKPGKVAKAAKAVKAPKAAKAVKAAKAAPKAPAKKVAKAAKRPQGAKAEKSPKGQRAGGTGRPLKAVRMIGRPRSADVGPTLEKPWPIARIRAFMKLWGMSQVEMAVFCDVSYDSVTSWSRGRRRLVRRAIADHLERAENSGKERGFVRAAAGRGSPWMALRRLCQADGRSIGVSAPPTPLLGHFAIGAVETGPRQIRLATKQEELVIQKGKGKDDVVVKINLGKKEMSFEGQRRILGGVEAIALQTDPKDPQFFSGRVGCITIAQDLVRVALWPVKNLIPLRMVASA